MGEGDTSFLSLLASFTLKMEIGRLSSLHTIRVVTMTSQFSNCGRVSERMAGARGVISNARSASALKPEWEAHSLDQHMVASVQVRLKNCFRWNSKTAVDMQVWAKSLGNTFRAGLQSFREHLAEGGAAVASWQVFFKKEGLT